MHRFIFSIFMSALVMLSCGTRQSNVVSPASTRLSSHIMSEASKIQNTQQDFDAVFELLNQSLNINPDNTAALYTMSLYESALGHRKAQDSLLARALHTAPDNVDILRNNASSALENADYPRAMSLLNKLARLSKSKTPIYQRLFQLHLKQQQPDSAVLMLSHIEALEGMSRSISETKHRLLLSMKDTVGAMKELQTLQTAFPNDPDIQVLIAEAYSDVLGRTDTAQIILNNVASRSRDNASLLLAQMHLYEKTDTTVWEAYRDSLLFGDSINAEVRYTVLSDELRQINLKDSVKCQEGADLIDEVTRITGDDRLFISLYATYLQETHIYPERMIDVFNRLISVDPSNQMGLITLIDCYIKQNKANEVSRVCDLAISFYPHEPVFYLYSGLGHVIAGDTIQALERLSVGCEHITATTRIELAAELYQTHGDMLHAVERYDEAYAAYDSCLTYQPDNILCLNNYAYFLSLDNRDLEKAERMSKMTLTKEPDNKTYLDTYAWILFMMGRYDEAATYIERVIKDVDLDSDSISDDVTPDVLEHAGDIYYCAGKTDLALPFWETALKQGCKSKTLKQKIKQKQYINQ